MYLRINDLLFLRPGCAWSGYCFRRCPLDAVNTSLFSGYFAVNILLHAERIRGVVMDDRPRLALNKLLDRFERKQSCFLRYGRQRQSQLLSRAAFANRSRV